MPCLFLSCSVLKPLKSSNCLIFFNFSAFTESDRVEGDIKVVERLPGMKKIIPKDGKPKFSHYFVKARHTYPVLHNRSAHSRTKRHAVLDSSSKWLDKKVYYQFQHQPGECEITNNILTRCTGHTWVCRR